MYIGIDLGGTTIQAGLVDLKGQMLFKNSVATPKDHNVASVVAVIDALIDECIEKTESPVLSIGIGIPGLVNYERDMVLTCKNLNWEFVPLVKMMKNRDIPVLLDNDANAATYAEYKFGSLQGVHNGIMLTLGTGIGGGVIVNGTDYRGSFGMGFEVGHMVIGDNFYDCNCGRTGCFETFASATALIKYTQHLLSQGKNSVLNTLDKLTAKDIIEASKEGDQVASEAYDRLISYLATGIVNLINLFDPEKIAIGGGLSGAGDYLLTPLKKKVKAQLFISDQAHAELLLATMKNDAGIVGAAFVGVL